MESKSKDIYPFYLSQDEESEGEVGENVRRFVIGKPDEPQLVVLFYCGTLNVCALSLSQESRLCKVSVSLHGFTSAHYCLRVPSTSLSMVVVLWGIYLRFVACTIHLLGDVASFVHVLG